MANEARVNSSLILKVGNIDFQSKPTTFQCTVTGVKGPTPGAITVSTTGTNIDFSQLTTPGLCVLQNLDSTNYVEYGIYEAATGSFFPLGEIGPGETYVLKLSRNLGEENVAGSGTFGSVNSLRMIANTSDCVVVVGAFEK